MLKQIALFGILVLSASGQGSKADYERASSLAKRTDIPLLRNRVEPQWDGDTFWYRVESARGRFDYVHVDCVKGIRALAFDHEKLASALTTATGRTVDGGNLGVDDLSVNTEGNYVTFRHDGKHWRFSRDTGALAATQDRRANLNPKPASGAGADSNSPETRITFINKTKTAVQTFWVDDSGGRRPYRLLEPGETVDQHTFTGHIWIAETRSGVLLGKYEGRAGGSTVELVEPARPAKITTAEKKEEVAAAAWKPFIRNFNVFIKQRASGEETQLSRDGSKDDAYSEPLHISPDGRRLVAIRVKPEQERTVYFVESSPRDQLQPKLHKQQYLKPGDRIRQERPALFDLEKREEIPLDTALFANPWDISDLRWSTDSSQFTFVYNQRGHQVLRIVKIGADGRASTLLEDTSATFIDYSQKHWRRWLEKTDEILWSSERDGWHHLYLFDGKTGTMKSQVTRGKWNVRTIERIDEEKRQIWLRVSGVFPAQDPYYIHFARVNFDGTGFTLLTAGDGTRSTEGRGSKAQRMGISPNGKWLVDTFSRVDMPPVTELRNAETGTLVCELERANADAIIAAGWTVPERFSAKGRDGKTDIFGIIIRPSNFDPAKKYPVVEEIYAGPHGAFVPKSWGRQTRQHAIAELGFIVVQIDGMGTNFRGKAFHDIAWRNIKDGGFPDRIAWMREAAATRPWMDLSRVGIYGGSAGGQNTLAALLHHGEFYKVGIADCGCHDNRMDKIWWNEAWMGEVGPWYADNSNVVHASKLTGKLMLIVGEVDTNVDPASTMQVADALIKADKDFDLLVMTSTNHGSAETPYASRRRMDFLVRHLHGVEPRAK
jgi:dipeptidyl-peptidase 4